MWIQDMMYRGALPERVLQGVRHALRHVQDLGFASASAPVQNLTFCTDILESLVGVQGTALKEVALLQQHYASVKHLRHHCQVVPRRCYQGERAGLPEAERGLEEPTKEKRLSGLDVLC